MTASDNSQREITGEGPVVNQWVHWISPTGERIDRTWANFKNGSIPWDTLDDDELGRGKLRDVNGQFRGSVYDRVIPRAMVAEQTRRLKERYDDKIREKLLELQGVHMSIALDASVPPADRLRAAAYVQERLIGKVPDKVEVVAEVKPWEGMVEGVLTDLPEDS